MLRFAQEYSLDFAHIGDASDLIAIDLAAGALFESTGLIKPHALSDHVPLDVLREAIAKQCVMVVRGTDEHAVGFALFSWRENDPYLDQISMDPNHSQQGLGRRLLKSVFETVRNRGGRTICLSTFRDLPWNGPFYRSAGFREIPRDKLKPYMIEIEEAQAPLMDVSQRCFMRKRLSAFPFVR